MKILKFVGPLGAGLIILATVGLLSFNAKVRAQDEPLGARGKVVGQVVDKEMKPVVGWPVEIRGVAGTSEGKHTVAFTDPEGTYQASLPPGKYDVSAVNRPKAEGKTFEMKKGTSLVKADKIMLGVKVAEGK